MQIIEKPEDKRNGISLEDSSSSSKLQHGKFNFAIIGQAEGNKLELFELLHFAMTELNLTCEFVKLSWDVSLKSEYEN